MTDTIPKGIYPFSTKDGRFIPLDILKPESCAYVTVTPAGASLVIPADNSEVAIFYAKVDTLITYAPTAPILAEGSFIADSLFIPANHAIVSSIKAGTMQAKAMGAESGLLTVQQIVRWGSLDTRANNVKR